MAESSPLGQRRPMLRLRYLSRAVHLVIVGAAALRALACAPSALPARDDDIGSTDRTGILDVADCDSPVGGIDLGAELEADGDFAVSLAELPGRLADASELTRETGELAPFIREVLAWMLEQPHATLGTISLDILAEGDPLAQSVALAFLDGDGVRPDVRTLRRGLHRYYACARALPLALDDLIEEAGGVDSSTTSLVERSEPKGHPRRLTVSNDGLLFLAETLVDGAVRETEAVWQGQRADGALEFLVYDDNGRLRDGSNFVTSIGAESPAAAPYACLACHRDRANGEGFVTVFPPPR
jgi:hypothetical protein